MGLRAKKQGISPGKCQEKGKDKTKKGTACQITLKYRDGISYQLISSSHLSRPEHYFSIYQSVCNMDCRKCHSWHFSQHEDPEGEWMSPNLE